MTLAYIVYFVIGVAVLAVLTLRLNQVGQQMGKCTQNAPTMQIILTSLITGFFTIGMGGLILLGLVLSSFAAPAPTTLILALGLMFVALGFAFTQAVSILRGAVTDVIAQPS